MAAVPQEVAPVQSETIADVLEFPSQVTPFKLEIIYVNYPEPLDPAVRMRSDIRTSAANHVAGVVGFGSWISIVELASIPDKKVAVTASSLSFIGNALLWRKSFKSERSEIEARYASSTE
jgi:hypothetical protein